MRAFRVLALAALVGVLTTCGGEDVPTTGWLTVRLASPNNDDAGLLFTVAGGTIDSVRSKYPALHTLKRIDGSWRIIVVGTNLSGVVAEVWVPDLSLVNQYSATIEQVAAESLAQRSANGYQLRVER